MHGLNSLQAKHTHSHAQFALSVFCDILHFVFCICTVWIPHRLSTHTHTHNFAPSVFCAILHFLLCKCTVWFPHRRNTNTHNHNFALVKKTHLCMYIPAGIKPWNYEQLDWSRSFLWTFQFNVALVGYALCSVSNKQTGSWYNIPIGNIL